MAEGTRGPSPWRDPAFLGFVGLTFISALIFVQAFSTYSVHHEEAYAYTESDVGILFAINTLLIVLIEMPLTARFERHHPLRMVGVGTALLATGLGLLAFTPDPGWLHFAWPFVAVTILTVGEMLFGPFGAAHTARRAPSGAEGRWYGLFNAAFSLATILAPSVGFWVYQHLGPLLPLGWLLGARPRGMAHLQLAAVARRLRRRGPDRLPA